MTSVMPQSSETIPSHGGDECVAQDRLRITVLAGGPSTEREISLQSGAAVHAALQRVGHEVILRDIGPGDLSALDEPTDFVFIALHGEFGEDGTVQAALERRGLPYSGCGSASSRLAMDKVAAKRRFVEAGLPTPRFKVFDTGNVSEVAAFGVPAVVKPVGSGSSVDTSIVRSYDELRAHVEVLVTHYGTALVEQYIGGPELTVGVVGEQALPVCEIRTCREFYDYQAKYIDDDTEYVFEPAVPQSLLPRVQELGLAAHRALGCEVFSRLDLMVGGTSNEPYLLEINTIPGFTSHSLLPKAAARVGISFEQLCQKIVVMSLATRRVVHRV